MKRKIGKIYNKLIVVGDKNLVAKNEVHKSELSRDSEGEESVVYPEYLIYFFNGTNSDIEINISKKTAIDNYNGREIDMIKNGVVVIDNNIITINDDFKADYGSLAPAVIIPNEIKIDNEPIYSAPEFTPDARHTYQIPNGTPEVIVKISDKEYIIRTASYIG